MTLRWNSFSTLLSTTLLVALNWGCTPQTPQDSSVAPATETMPFVAVTQIVEHPALDATRDGIQDELKAAGYTAGETLTWKWESAQGSPATAAQIASAFVAEKPDVIVAIATPSAQAAVSASSDIPVIFSAVTDPVGAKLVEKLDQPGGLVTGVSDLSPIENHVSLMQEINPNLKTIGVIYNAGEVNAVSLVNLLKEQAQAKGLSVVEATVANSSGVATAAQSLVGKADVIYVPTDNTVVSALESVLQVGIDNKIGVYSGDTDSVERGAIASLGFDYYDVGRQTGKQVVRVLQGESPGNLSVESVDTLNLYVNPKAAEAMGVTLPQSVIDRADTVVKSEEESTDSATESE
ncbi:ABC transporter substrate-binding protein [Roseofilum sp. BLCC_M154]|uniref:ABC transporter substrate-binding protein n=1 Tax=Roseofilum acuticapitatum BLCC-M154 TaxID=3022444 RepID=A0ABT7AZW9_9CYAN|nr:ABC transporter substrate-binding protein [Roseofilum acuticapitatum]MDJ1171816.1 ABC transporter substrate-binding protein [Roseofilum acuticapitatum BLCC-M154]